MRQASVRWLTTQAAPMTAEEAASRAWVRMSMDVGGPPGAQISRLLARWPQSVDIAWFAWQHCVTGCDRHAMARHLVDVDWRNGAAWLAMLEEAGFKGDVAGVDDALARAAAAPAFDRRHGHTYLRLQPVFAELAPSPTCRQLFADSMHANLAGPPTEEAFADLMAQSFEMATTMPGFALVRECDARRDDPRVRARRPDCIAVLRRLAEEPDLGERLSALTSLVRWLGPDSSPYREQLRQMHWLRHVLPRLRLEGPAASLWSVGQIAYFRGRAAAQGLWPPPPAWLPEDEATRRLIVEGH